MDNDKNLSLFELIVMSLTIFVIFSISLQYIIEVNTEMRKLLNVFDFICSGIFIIE